MTRNERVRILRKTLGLTMEKFGNTLGVTRVAISNIERGNRNLTEQMIKSICREYDVNENWLRDGDGEMFLPVSRERNLARLTRDLLMEESSSFRNRFIQMLAGLTESEWEWLEKKAMELLNPIDDSDVGDDTSIKDVLRSKKDN